MSASRDACAAVLRTEAITKVYRSGLIEVQALRGVDLSLQPAEIVVLLGASGSGKSTLVNILGGLDRPTEGRVLFHGRDIARLPEAALTAFRRAHVGFVFQFYNLVPSLTARENVALVTEIAADPMRPEEALERVGLGHRLDHFPAELSGGEQQRVAIARAIAKRPEILLCDEPTGALDSATGVTVLAALVEVNRDLGAATAIITHNAAIARIAHRVLYMADGRIAREERNAVRAEPSEVTW
ncbi:ABC transporter ATP-binding protein [Cereibacter sediminicola]|uniref:ABC transporter ATP-binding protein n=1 Tax=Cereibacter sediminicola TaxID=2584941 RepID=UPI0011A6908E|nr:ABC transporter ATP-binding protein [Cereibacter sediminicola]